MVEYAGGIGQILKGVIENARVKCLSTSALHSTSSSSSSNFCNWEGKLTDMPQHLMEECCHFKYSCNVEDCRHITTGWQERRTHSTLHEQLSQCPKGCGQEVPIAFMERHLNNFCANVEVSCPFYEHGCSSTCNGKVLRSQRESHVMAASTITEVNVKMMQKIHKLEGRLKDYENLVVDLQGIVAQLQSRLD